MVLNLGGEPGKAGRPWRGREQRYIYTHSLSHWLRAVGRGVYIIPSITQLGKEMLMLIVKSKGQGLRRLWGGTPGCLSRARPRRIGSESFEGEGASWPGL